MKRILASLFLLCSTVVMFGQPSVLRNELTTNGNIAATGRVATISRNLAKEELTLSNANRVVGPASSLDNAVAIFSGTGGKLVKDSSGIKFMGSGVATNFDRITFQDDYGLEYTDTGEFRLWDGATGYGTLALGQISFAGSDPVLLLPNGATPTTDAFAEIAADNNAWAASRGAVQFFDGTANTFLIGALASDSPSNGQVPKWNTGGTITWEADNTGAGASLPITWAAGEIGEGANSLLSFDPGNSMGVAASLSTNGDFTVGSSLTLSGPLIQQVQRIGNGTIDVSTAGTNHYHLITNASTAITFSGASVAGQRVFLTVSNHSSSDIIITNSLGIFRPSVGSNVTLFTVRANSEWNASLWTNGAQARWEIFVESGLEYELAASGNNSMVTNENTVSVHGSASAAFNSITSTQGVGYVNQTIAGVGGANTNFTGQATDGVVYINGGTTNVNFVAIMPGTAGLTYFPTYVITNLTTTSRLVSFSSVTNFLIPLQFYDGISFPITLTNKHRLILSTMLNGSNLTWSAKQCTNGF